MLPGRFFQYFKHGHRLELVARGDFLDGLSGGGFYALLGQFFAAEAGEGGIREVFGGARAGGFDDREKFFGCQVVAVGDLFDGLLVVFNDDAGFLQQLTAAGEIESSFSGEHFQG